MASRLYKAGVTQPWTRHVQPCRYTRYNVLFLDMDGIMQALPGKKMQWKVD